MFGSLLLFTVANLKQGGEDATKIRRRRKKKKRRGIVYPMPVDYVAAVMEAEETGHVDLINREAMQQLTKEDGGKKIVKPQEVKAATGPALERWKLAAEAELTKNFMSLGAFHDSTAEEIAQHGRPLPMLCVWSQDGDLHKCRACVCGNFAQVDPTQQSWTAQAEPSSLLAAVKLGRMRGSKILKHDVGERSLTRPFLKEKRSLCNHPHYGSGGDW